MKPFFALTLDDESIGLLHRRPEGWRVVGSVRFDTAELSEALAALRARAQELEPEGLGTKLILPGSQILYSMVYAPGPGRAVRRAQVEAGLEGQTPYELDELIFDWSGEGEHVAVAAVARETLAEAEAFAVEHGFNPLCFVANPDGEGFSHAPWFGLTAHAREQLADPAGFERDDALLVILPPEPEPAVEEPAVDAPVADERADAPSADLAQDAAEAGAAPQGPTAEDALEDAAPRPEPQADAPPEMATPAATTISESTEAAVQIPDAAPAAPEALQSAKGEQPHIAPAAVEPEAAPVEILDAPAPGPLGANPVDADPTPADLPAAGATPAQASAEEPPPFDWRAEVEIRSAAPRSEPPAPAAAEPAAAEPVVPSVAPAEAAPPLGAAAAKSGPAQQDGSTAPEAKARGAGKPVAASLAASLANQRSPGSADDGGEEGEQTQSWPGEEEGDGDPLGATKAALAASLDPAPALADPVRSNAARVEGGGKRIEPLPAMPAGGPRLNLSMPQPTGTATLTEKPPKSIAKPGKGAKVKITPSLKGNSPALPASASKPNLTPPETEAEAMTLFGKRNERRVGGKPRYLGLALTGALLVILLLIAVWAASFLEPDTQSSVLETVDPPAASLTGAETGPPGQTADAGRVEPSELADAVTAGGDGPAPAPAETATAPLDANGATAAGLAQGEAAAAAPSLTETAAAAARAAGEAAAELAPAPASAPAEGPMAVSGAVETLTRPLPDGAVTSPPLARLASPAPTTGDAAPAPPSALPAFGALFKFDEAGNIIPTPEGVVTPDGVTLMAARPSRLPPQRPAGLVPEAPAPVSTAVAPAPASSGPAVPGPAVPAATESATAAADALSATVSTSSGFQPDQTHAGQRPRHRPGNLAPTPVPPAAEEGALPVGEEGSSRASLRPASRPASIVAAATAAERELSAAAEVAMASATSLAALDPSLLPLTRRPPARPASLVSRANTATATAAAAAAAAAAATQQTASLASPALQARLGNTPRPTERQSREAEVEDDGEPEVTRAAPAIPTRASVAKQATISRGLKLGGLNLIGVFGTSNARYALVRDTGGRMNQVRVGDRLDGGQVVSIGQSELAYRKRGGQTVRLQMPRG